MDARQFVAEFGHIAHAPGGVARLRELVIHLAIHGKLIIIDRYVGRDEARKLLEQAEDEKNRLIREGGARRFQSLPPMPESDATKYPEHWAVTRLGAVIHLISGQHLGPQEQNTTGNGIPYFTGASDFGVIHPVVSRWTEEKRAAVRRGDILIAVKGTIGKINFLNIDEAALGRQLMAIRTLAVDPRFVALVLRHSESHFVALSIGIAIPGISREDILHLPLGVPPLEEQSRIVAKVDELMALCDKLEAQQQERRTLQNALRQVTLQAVATAASPHELHTTWTRLAGNFGRLFQAPEDIRALRDVIFDLSLRGMFLPTVATGSETPGTDAPSLPAGWSWKTLGELSEYITSGSRGWKSYISTSGDAFIRSQDIRNDALIFENPAFVSLPEKTEGKRTLVREGDLLLTITGGNVGKCARVPALSGNAYVSQHVALIRLADPDLSEFVHFWMINTYGGRGFLARYIYGDKPGLNLAQVASVSVPVPIDTDILPILESLRHYQEMCDRFEEQVKNKSDIAKLLAIAAVSSFTGITTEQEDAPMKTPQTELIAPLRLGQTPNIKAQAPLAAILARHNGEMGANDLWRRFGGEIDAFYAQLKTEVSHGWILEPAVAEMREIQTTAGA